MSLLFSPLHLTERKINKEREREREREREGGRGSKCSKMDKVKIILTYITFTVNSKLITASLIVEINLVIIIIIIMK